MYFGEFRFDPKRLSLSIATKTLPLKRQSAKVLALLLKVPGQLVTREEIRNHVWHDRTIEFDHGINAAIRDIRKALGDDPKAPHFIATQSKIGYRFLADVNTTGGGFSLTRLRVLAVIGIIALGAISIGMATNGNFAYMLGMSTSRLAVMPVRNNLSGEDAAATAVEWTNFMVRRLSEGQQRARIISAGELFGEAQPEPSMANITRWLEADYLLAGTLEHREAGDSLNLRLIQTDGYVHIWAKTVSLNSGSYAVFEPLVAEIAAAIDIADR
jgi:DNA-binding winged helix-turn-helix (wHTH) protein/TolB-like protein